MRELIGPHDQLVVSGVGRGWEVRGHAQVSCLVVVNDAIGQKGEYSVGGDVSGKVVSITVFFNIVLYIFLYNLS